MNNRLVSRGSYKMKQVSILLIFMTSVGLARIEKSYIDLLSVDGEKMSREIDAKLQPLRQAKISARKRHETTVDALRLIFGRWDQDGFRDKIYQNIRRAIGDDEDLVKANAALADEALLALKHQNGSVRELSTYVIVLENLMAQIHPQLATESEYFRLFTEVREAKLKIPEKVQKDRKLRGLLPFESPSDKAATALKGVRRRPAPKPSSTPESIEDPELELELDQNESEPELELED